MLCVTSQLARENGGGEGRVIVLDTDNKFRLDRVGEIAEKRFGLSRDDVLENIMYAKCNTHEQQMEMIGVAMGKIAESAEPIRMIVVDSVMALYRTEFTGRGELAVSMPARSRRAAPALRSPPRPPHPPARPPQDRQQKLGSHLRDLCKLAQEFNVAVVLTNQMTADPGNAMVADAKKPVGGNILAHSVDSRIYLRKGRGTQRIAKIYAGPHPESEATFSITDKGIVEAE
jgi:meiotic recombination protein DMC1